MDIIEEHLRKAKLQDARAERDSCLHIYMLMHNSCISYRKALDQTTKLCDEIEQNLKKTRASSYKYIVFACINMYLTIGLLTYFLFTR